MPNFTGCIPTFFLFFTYIYVYVYICIYIYIYVCIYIYVYIYIHTRIFTYIYIHTIVSIYIHILYTHYFWVINDRSFVKSPLLCIVFPSLLLKCLSNLYRYIALPIYIYIRTGWWFGTWILFSTIYGNVIIPTDFHIFQRGWNHQPYIYIYMCVYCICIYIYTYIYIHIYIYIDWWFFNRPIRISDKSWPEIHGCQRFVSWKNQVMGNWNPIQHMSKSRLFNILLLRFIFLGRIPKKIWKKGFPATFKKH